MQRTREGTARRHGHPGGGRRDVRGRKPIPVGPEWGPEDQKTRRRSSHPGGRRRGTQLDVLSPEKTRKKKNRKKKKKIYIIYN